MQFLVQKMWYIDISSRKSKSFADNGKVFLYFVFLLKLWNSNGLVKFIDDNVNITDQNSLIIDFCNVCYFFLFKRQQ